MSNKKSSQISDHFTLGKLLLFALPTVITLLFGSVYGIVDGIFVSGVGGNEAFAAINLASPIFAILASLGFMFGTGGTALVSKILGEGDGERANGVFSLITYSMIIVGIVFTIIAEIFYEPALVALGAKEEMMPYCLTYGRIIIPFLTFFMLQFFFQSFMPTAGKPKFGLVVTLIAGFTNIIGDAILVGVVAKGSSDVPNFAVAGAAIATAAGLLLGGIIPFIFFIRKNSSTLRLGKPFMELKNVLKTCTNGMSEFLSNVSASIVSTVYNGILLYYIGTNGVSAYGAIGYLNTIFMAIFMGFSIGVSPIVGYNYGSQNHDELKSVFKKSLIIITCFSVGMFLISEFLAAPLSSLFIHGTDENAKALFELTVNGFSIFAVSFMLKGFNTYGSAFFTALNNGFVSGLLSVLRALVFGILSVIFVPLLFLAIGGENAGIDGIWWAATFAEGLALIVTIIFLIANKKKYNY